MKKKLGISLLVVVICLLIGGLYFLYLKNYQRVIDEAAKLSDNHCIAVNPLIIDWRTAYIGSMKSAIKGDGRSYISAQYSWLGSAKEYLTLEKLWLANARAFLSRLDTKFLLAGDQLESLNWQITMHQASYNETQHIVSMFADKKDVNLKDLNDAVVKLSNDQKIAQEAYNLRWGNGKRQPTFHDQFIRLPSTQCPEKDQKLPDVEKELGL